MRTAKLTQGKFAKLAMCGGVVEFDGLKYWYDNVTEKFLIGSIELQDAWLDFNGLNEFTIIKEPNAEVELTWNGYVTPEEMEESLAKALEKPKFPAFEDIATYNDEHGTWLELGTSWFEKIISKHANHLTIKEQYDIFKTAYENGVNVTWKLKEKPALKVGEWVEHEDGEIMRLTQGIPLVKVCNDQGWKPINRKLHENRALAVAVGKWLVDNDSIEIAKDLFLEQIKAEGYLIVFYFFNTSKRYECTLSTDLDLTKFIEQYRIERAKLKKKGE